MCFCAIGWRKWVAIGVFVGIGMLSGIGYAERIVAVIGNQVITEFDLQQVLNEWRYSGMISKGSLSDGLTDIRKKALDRLVEEELLYQEAKSRNINVSPDIVEARIEEIEKKFPSEEAFQDSLKKSGLTRRDLYKRIERQFMISKLISSVIRPRVYISPQETTQEFDKDRKKFCKVNKVNISTIFIPKGNFSEMDFELLVMDEYSKLKNGHVTWRDLVAKYGEGQISGWKKASDLSDDMVAVLFDPDVPKYPKPVRVSTGYMMFRVEGIDKDCPNSLGKVKRKVYDYLYQKKFQEELKKFIEELKNKYYVKIYE